MFVGKRRHKNHVNFQKLFPANCDTLCDICHKCKSKPTANFVFQRQCSTSIPLSTVEFMSSEQDTPGACLEGGLRYSHPSSGSFLGRACSRAPGGSPPENPTCRDPPQTRWKSNGTEYVCFPNHITGFPNNYFFVINKYVFWSFIVVFVNRPFNIHAAD